jgi:hypothetical protein
LKSLDKTDPAGATTIGEQPGATEFPIEMEAMTAYDYVMATEPWMFDWFLDTREELEHLTQEAARVAALLEVPSVIRRVFIEPGEPAILHAFPRKIWDAIVPNYG